MYNGGPKNVETKEKITLSVGAGFGLKSSFGNLTIWLSYVMDGIRDVQFVHFRYLLFAVAAILGD